VKVNVFVNTSCAKSGGLKKEDFSLTENGTPVAIENMVFTGRAMGQSVDLAVVFDDTGSMSGQIEAMKAKVQELIDQMTSSGLDARYALISFKDAEEVRTSWTADAPTFKGAVNSLSAAEGDDTPEDALDAIEAALAMGFRPEAQKVILVITDAPAHQRGDGTTFTERTGDEVRSDLLASGAIFITVSAVLSDPSPGLDLKNLAEEVGGTWIDMASADFTKILDRITTMITGMYVLEYTSPDLMPGTARTVKVNVDKQPCAKGSATGSYSSPSGTISKGAEIEIAGPSSSSPGPVDYPLDEGAIAFSLTFSKPGVILDTVGINAADTGDFVIRLQDDGRLVWQIYDPDLESDILQESGWHILESDIALEPGRWYDIEAIYGIDGLVLLVDGELVASSSAFLMLSGNPVYVGDYPGDDGWGEGYNIHPAFTGQIRELRMGSIESIGTGTTLIDAPPGGWEGVSPGEEI
jgi:hypothetical protein